MYLGELDLTRISSWGFSPKGGSSGVTLSRDRASFRLAVRNPFSHRNGYGETKNE
jgi:hypothetical protein